MGSDRSIVGGYRLMSFVLAWAAQLLVAADAVAGPELFERAYSTIRGGSISRGSIQLKAAYMDLVLQSCRAWQGKLNASPDQTGRVCGCMVESASAAKTDDEWLLQAATAKSEQTFDPMPLVKTLMSPALQKCSGGGDARPSQPQSKSLLIEGTSAFRSGDFVTAERLFERAYRLSLAEHGAEHPETINALMSLAAARAASGNLSSLEAPLNVALKAREHDLGERHPDTVALVLMLGALKFGAGKVQEALTLAESGWRLSSEVLGQKHPATADAAETLAMIYTALGRTVEALPLQQQVMLVRDAAGDAPKAARATRNLAETLYTLGRDAEAMPLFEKLVKPSLATSDPLTAAAASDTRRLAGLYESAGRDAEARSLRQVLAKRGRLPDR